MRRISKSTKILISTVVGIIILSGLGIEVPKGLNFTGFVLDLSSFAVDMWPPDTTRQTMMMFAKSALVTLEIATLGTAIAAIAGIPMAILSSRRVMDTDKLPERIILNGTRLILNGVRSVHSLVWAIIFVAALGLGPFAGVLAIATHNSGVFGKMYSEYMDGVNRRPLESMRSLGATKMQTVLYGIFPQAFPEMASYTIYRWECSVRAATVLGMVGAGGIGFYIILAIRMVQFDQLLTGLIFILVIVSAGDIISSIVRETVI